MKVFWILLILALLFVIGSAGMMRYFDGKTQVKSKKLDKPDKPDKP